MGKATVSDSQLRKTLIFSRVMRSIPGRAFGLAVLVLVWSIFSWPYLRFRHVPFPSTYLVTFFPPWSAEYGMPVKNGAMPDVITQIYPWKKLTIESWKAGQVPLWNPYSFSGVVHAANFQTAVFTPFNVLFFLMPFVDAWSVLILLQPLLASMFMFMFLRSVNQSKFASCIGAISFAYCGFMVTWMAYGTLGYAILWLPVSLYAIEKFKHTLKWQWGMLLSMAVCLSFFSGHFQISLYMIGMTISYIVFRFWDRTNTRLLLYPLFFVAFGVLLSMPQLLPAFDAFEASYRKESFGSGAGIAWQYAITSLVPDFFGNPVTRNDWFGQYAEWASYIGVIPFALALVAFVVSKKKGHVRFWWLSSIVVWAIAFPTPLNSLLFSLKIPALSTSVASRIIVLFSFSLSVLAGFGFDVIRTTLGDKKESLRRYVLTVGTLLLLVCVWLGFGVTLGDKFHIALRNSILSIALLTGLVVWLVMFRNAGAKWKSACLILIVILSALDSLRYAKKWMPFDPREYVFPDVGISNFLGSKVKNDRVFGNLGNEVGSYFSVPLLEGYDAMYPRRYGEFASFVNTGAIGALERSVVQLWKSGKHIDRALSLLGVRYIVHRVSDGRNVWAYPYWNYPSDTLPEVYNDEKYMVFENLKALPRVYFASSYTIKHDEEILKTLFNDSFDLAQSVVLEEGPELEPKAGDGDVQITSYSPNIVDIYTNTSVAKLVVLSDRYDLGWAATIDGKHTKIFRANYDFRAISVPPGEHQIRFTYESRSFRTGVVWFIGTIVAFYIFRQRYAYRHK